MSRLWGQTKAKFYSTVEPGVQDELEEIDVSLDFEDINVDDYAAVIMAANYPSVRLRWFDEKQDFVDSAGKPREINSINASEAVLSPPAVKFFRKAMQNSKIIKGIPCHALWLLTPSPDILAGRKVICNKVVLADVINAGAIYTPCPPGTPEEKQVIVDRDLVTNIGWHASAELVDRIRDLILNPRSLICSSNKSSSHEAVSRTGAAGKTAIKEILSQTADKITRSLEMRFHQVPSNTLGFSRPVAKAAGKLLNGNLDVIAEVKRMTGIDMGMSQTVTCKPILLVASKFGTWASELTLVASVLLRAGYKVKIATEDGSPPHLLGPSLNPEFTDGAWRCSVVSPEERDLALRFLNPDSPERKLFVPENILNLGNLAKPPQVGDYLKNIALLNRYREELTQTVGLAADYDALIIAGGSGAIPGLMADRGLHNLILAFHDLGKPVMGECNGGLAIAQTTDPNTGKSILFGRAVTTHSWLDEYQSGWGWTQDFPRNTDSFWNNGEFDLAAYLTAEQWNAPGTGGNPLIDSEGVFKNAAGKDGVFFSPPGSAYSVVVDGNLITCRTTPDGYPGVLALIAILDGKPPLKGRLFIDADEQGRLNP